MQPYAVSASIGLQWIALIILEKTMSRIEKTMKNG
jgi:hypothetical protein